MLREEPPSWESLLGFGAQVIFRASAGFEMVGRASVIKTEQAAPRLEIGGVGFDRIDDMTWASYKCRRDKGISRSVSTASVWKQVLSRSLE